VQAEIDAMLVSYQYADNPIQKHEISAELKALQISLEYAA